MQLYKALSYYNANVKKPLNVGVLKKKKQKIENM